MKRLVLLAASCGVAYFIVFRSRIDIVPASMALPEAVGPYRAAGFYWTMADVPHRVVPEAENAAGLLRQAMRGWVIQSTTIHRLRDVPQAQALVASKKGALLLVEQASRLPYLDFHRDWDCPSSIEFPEYSPEQSFVKTLCLRAQIKSMTGDPDGSEEDLGTAFRLCRLYSQEPALVGYQLAIDCEACVLKTVELCAGAEAKNGSALKRLSQLLAGNPPQSELTKTLKSEAYFELATLRNESSRAILSTISLGMDLPFGDPPSTPKPDSVKRSGYPDSVLGRALLTRDLQMWTKLAHSIKQYSGEPEHLGAILDAAADSENRDVPESDDLLENLFPMAGLRGWAESTRRAEFVCTQALVQALMIHAGTGVWPESVLAIPGRWIDPFNGQPVHVKRRGDEIRIYSVGPDGVDNGGVGEMEAAGPGYDIVVVYPPSASEKSASPIPFEDSDSD